MSTPSRHDELTELLPAAALEILESEDLVRVLSHTRECSECAALLDEYRATLADLALAIPSAELAAERSRKIRSRLLARPGGHPAQARARLTGIERWSGWAVAAGLAGVLLVHHGFHRPLAYGWVVAGLAAIALVGFGIYAMVQRRRIAALEERLRALSSGE